MIIKCISGGQTGADLAALKAAKEFGIPTGGWLPKGCRTLNGPCPELLEEFSMKEHSSANYALRTEANVKDSDGTIRFAANFSSPGEKCTKKAINWFKKPSIDINIKNPLDHSKIVEWILENNIQILNVAGNAEQTAPGIEAFVKEYLLEVFSILAKRS